MKVLEQIQINDLVKAMAVETPSGFKRIVVVPINPTTYYRQRDDIELTSRELEHILDLAKRNGVTHG